MMEGKSPPALLVRDLMTIGVATCGPDTPVADITRLMVERGLEAVVVLDSQEGHALGVVGQDELVHAYVCPEAQSLKAEDVMTDGVAQVPADIPLQAAAQLMCDRGVRALFMMHHSGGIEYPAAVITYQHFLRHLAARTADELRDLGIQANRQSPVEAFFHRRDEARKRNQPKEQS